MLTQKELKDIKKRHIIVKHMPRRIVSEDLSTYAKPYKESANDVGRLLNALEEAQRKINSLSEELNRNREYHDARIKPLERTLKWL